MRVGPDGRPKIYDFGLGKDLQNEDSLTVTGPGGGTGGFSTAFRDFEDLFGDIGGFGGIFDPKAAGYSDLKIGKFHLLLLAMRHLISN